MHGMHPAPLTQKAHNNIIKPTLIAMCHWHTGALRPDKAEKATKAYKNHALNTPLQSK